jgi:hypothetical protein
MKSLKKHEGLTPRVRGWLILVVAVPDKLRLPSVLRSGLLFKLRLITAPPFAHYKNGFISCISPH